MRYLVVSLCLLLTGCVSNSNGTRPFYKYRQMSYQQPIVNNYYSQPTSYRIKPYHPMNSGMGF